MALPSMLCRKRLGTEGALIRVERFGEGGSLVGSFAGGVMSAAA
jgi:hypothetical protein